MTQKNDDTCAQHEAIVGLGHQVKSLTEVIPMTFCTPAT